MDLLAAEMTARTGKDVGDYYLELRRNSAPPATRASTRRRQAS